MMEAVSLDVWPLIDRSHMPQVDEKLYPNLLVFLGQRGLTFTAGLISPTLLKLHQEVDPEKAKAIPDIYLSKPILSAWDDFVLDGDHRSYRHFLNGTQVPFIRVEAEFYTALKAVLAFPGTYKVAK